MKFHLILIFIWGIINISNSNILTLSEAEHKAVTTGFEARANYFKEQAKECEKRNTIAKYLPTVDYSLNYMRMDEETVEGSNMMMTMMQDFFPDSGFDLEGSMSNNPNILFERSFKHEFSVNQPITNGGVEIIAIRMAKHTKNAIDYQIEASKQDAIYNTRKAYFDAISAVERAAVAKQDLAWTKGNLIKSEIKHKTGSVPITDLLQWKAEVSKKESEVLEAEATKRFMILTLYQTMGISVDNAESCQLQPFETFEKWYEKGPADTSKSTENNYQLKAIKEYTLVADGYKKIAMSSFLPKVNAFVSYSWPADSTIFTDKKRSWTAGAVLTVPLFSGFRNSTGYKKSNYEYMKTVVEEKEVESQLQVNLERIKLFYRASYEGVKAAKKQQELMERQLDIMQKRYDGGLVNQSQLLEVSLGASQTRIGYIQKIFECLLYETEYLKNIGQLEVAE